MVLHGLPGREPCRRAPPPRTRARRCARRAPRAPPAAARRARAAAARPRRRAAAPCRPRSPRRCVRSWPRARSGPSASRAGARSRPGAAAPPAGSARRRARLLTATECPGARCSPHERRAAWRRARVRSPRAGKLPACPARAAARPRPRPPDRAGARDCPCRGGGATSPRCTGRAGRGRREAHRFRALALCAALGRELLSGVALDDRHVPALLRLVHLAQPLPPQVLDKVCASAAGARAQQRPRCRAGGAALPWACVQAPCSTHTGPLSTCQREPLCGVHVDVVPVGDVLVVNDFGRDARVRVRAPQVLQELVQEGLGEAVNDCAAPATREHGALGM